jgi:murein DD-endopeptidase MepM/ murein hydrolase activator NlpD/phosphatidylglycerophosphatase A
MGLALANFLKERYLNSTDSDLGAVMSTAYDEYNNNILLSTAEKYHDAFKTETLFKNVHDLPVRYGTQSTAYQSPSTPVNHAIFAQNIVNESKTGKLFKTAQLFISSLATESNNGVVSPAQLGKIFKRTQGLIEVPTHLVLYIGGLYDFYYYGTPDNNIDLKTINGVSNKDGSDLLSNPLLLNKHYGSYAFDNNNAGLKAATLPFVKPLTPRFIDDLMSFDYESYRDQKLPKNYRDTYYDYEFKQDISLSNNISSHIPFSGYGVLNNYLNSMSYLYFNEGLDGQTNENSSLNDDGLPYHIIGNFRGKLKTFKTYNDQNINFLGSYNSYGPKVKFNISTADSDLNTITSAITFDNDFLYTDKNNKEKIEFFLLLSKIKCNFLGGYMDTVDVYNIVRKLCAINNLKAKQDDIEIPDFITLLIHSLIPPDGNEPDTDSNRVNRNLTILDKYNVDSRSFIGYIDIKTKEYNELYTIILMINQLTGNDLYDYASRLLVSMWSREFNQKENNKLKALDGRGSFVVYPSCGGDINVNNLFTQNDFDYGLGNNKASINPKYKYQKTNVVHTVFETQGDAYLSNLVHNDPEFLVIDSKVSNDITNYWNRTYLYSQINPGLAEFVSLNNSQNYSDRIIPKNVTANDTALMGMYLPVYFRPENAPSNGTFINYFDRYDDVYIIANTTDPEGVKRLKFDNKSLIYNTSRLFWFDSPNTSGVIYPETIKFAPKNATQKPDLISVDYYEYKHFHLKNGSVYDYKNGELFYDMSNTDEEVVRSYNDFKAGSTLYSTFENLVSNADSITNYYSDNKQIQDADSAKILLDIFDIDKLEDFRTLFKKFADGTQENYFNKTFNTFDFKSLLKHTTMFGYSNLPNSVELYGRSFGKDELLALICGYSGNFIEFASITGLAKVINTALTLGQEDKARFVIDEFLNAKITVNNYSTGGPLTIESSDLNNPNGLRLNSFIFNPIIAYSTNTRTYENIVASLGDVLLFRTILFGDQNISGYSDLDPGIDELVKKYVLVKGMTKNIDPNLGEDFVITELTRVFFRKLNIQLNEGNLKLLITYLRSFIAETLFKSIALNLYNGKTRLFDLTKDNYDSALIHPSKEGAKNQIYDHQKKKYIVISEIKNGVLIPKDSISYVNEKFEDFQSDIVFNDWVKKFNKDFVEKALTTLNGSLGSLHEKLLEKLTTNYNDTVDGDGYEYEDIKTDEIDIRTGTYYRIKTLYDKNVSYTNINATDDRLIKKSSHELGSADVNAILNSPLFFNFNVQQQDICDDNGLLTPSSDKLKDLVDYTQVLDRGNNPFGTKVFVDIVSFKQTLTDDLYKEGEINKTTSKSMWTILSKLASDHEFLLMPLTSYINLSGSVTEKDSPYDLAHDMFGVFNTLEMWESNPSFIFQLGSLTSSVGNGGSKKNSAKSNFDLSNSFCLDIDQNSLDIDGNGKILNEDVPSDVRNSNVSSFIVDFANPNQNMFESIQLSTDEFANTEESINAQVAIAGGQPVLSSGKLFSAMENRSYSCTVNSLGNATIQPLSYFYLRNVPLFYGTYWITNVSHKISANNTMTTTFKGVRQPIARKPTPNVAVIRALLKKAKELSGQQGYLDRDDATPIPTSGEIYTNRSFTGVSGTTSETKYGLLYQRATDEGVNKYVTYNGLWVIASYLKLMTGGDETDTVLIKTLISYLHNNASELAVSWDIDYTAPYFVDIVAYDLYNKLGYETNELSLSELLDNYPTTAGDMYQTTLYKLLEFQQKPNDLLAYLTLTAEEKYNPKTTLITNSKGTAITNDETLPKITFPGDFGQDNLSAITRVNYWVSDTTKSNLKTFNGLSTYELVSYFDTTPATPTVSIVQQTLQEAAIQNAIQLDLANPAESTGVVAPTLYPATNANLNTQFKFSLQAPAQQTVQQQLFAGLPQFNNNTQTTSGTTPRELGSQKDGSFDFSKAFSKTFTIEGYDEDLIAYVMGGYGKSKKYAFFKLCNDSEKFEYDTIKINKHAHIDLKILGQDNGNATGDTINKWTIKNVTSEQTDNIYVSPVRNGSGQQGSGLVVGWVNPLKDIYVTSGYGYQASRGRVHEGNDLRAALGTDVYAVLDGVVVSSQAFGGYGYAVILSHPNHGLSTLYGHVRERFVSAGDTVSAGQLIAKSGDEGSPGQPHLHFEVLKNAISLDNSNYFSSANQALLTDPEPYLKGEVIPNNSGGDSQTAGSGDVVSKGLDYTVAFLTDVLKGLGVSSPNSSQIKFMKAWRQHEGAKATYNPFNTTQKAAGATNFNSVGVKNFINRAQGLKATLDTLNNGRYGAIITAIKNIRNDDDINAAMQAVNDSPWGSNFSPVNYKSWKTLNNYIYGYVNEG